MKTNFVVLSSDEGGISNIFCNTDGIVFTELSSSKIYIKYQKKV